MLAGEQHCRNEGVLSSQRQGRRMGPRVGHRENVVLPEEFSSVLWKTLPFPSFLVGTDFGDKKRVAFHVISMGR